MEDLYVQPAYRSKGIGVKLWQQAVKTALEKGSSRCNWQCLNWNQSSIDFYKRQGGVNMNEAEGWLDFRMDKQTMTNFINK